MTITEITAENFRCFRKAEARLAPLTLLVGENSTGKTSFLSLVRALTDAGDGLGTPDFQRPPYDLGTFRDIAHRPGTRGTQAREFSGSFTARVRRAATSAQRLQRFRVAFTEDEGFTTPSLREYSSGDILFRETLDARFLETSRGSWDWNLSEEMAEYRRLEGFFPPFFALQELEITSDDKGNWPVRRQSPKGQTSGPTREDRQAISELVHSFMGATGRPFCSAPVRSRPQRTYDPIKLASDPEGENAPTWLDHLSRRQPEDWKALRGALDSFGRSAGLFDDLRVRHLARDGGPFQIQVRRHVGGKKGPWRNLIDVGYGVSQILPLLLELCRSEGPDLFLLQQPEVHLHPSAQAALGTLLCEIAASGRQILVETHSDHLMDRVRMDLRDRKTGLTPADASLLFFERGDLDVRIHSLGFGDSGEVLGAPPGYRQFFLEETERSIIV